MARKATFEDAMSRLNEIVRRLEEGDVPLEESMKLYEEGMRLGAQCRSILADAEQRIKRLASELEGEGAEKGARGD